MKMSIGVLEAADWVGMALRQSNEGSGDLSNKSLMGLDYFYNIREEHDYNCDDDTQHRVNWTPWCRSGGTGATKRCCSVLVSILYKILIVVNASRVWMLIFYSRQLVMCISTRVYSVHASQYSDVDRHTC